MRPQGPWTLHKVSTLFQLGATMLHASLPGNHRMEVAVEQHSRYRA
jgi:hypothetical protein